MGCECCKEFSPNEYAKCKLANNIPYKGKYIAPCGADFSKNKYNSNYTPPKKKRKRK